MKDSISDRIKITKSGKVRRMSMALGHSRANKSQKQILRKRNLRGLDMPQRIIKRYS